ncbi:MAG TPA: glycine betaine ABC transporter substrate-binding protein, partial [Methanomethylovorans sp.]|nr:glycine betaine ABC transporter substrate-binding protein [Methanomethylovorans sp.]
IYIMTENFANSNPDAVEALKKLDGRIDTDTMRELNYKFDVDKMEPRDIAREFLIQEGLIEA